MYANTRCEVVTTKRRIERSKSLKQEVLSFTSTALLKQNESFNCNGRRGNETDRQRMSEKRRETGETGETREKKANKKEEKETIDVL
jgi:hypothetical protein